jgi:hypothetical protein
MNTGELHIYIAKMKISYKFDFSNLFSRVFSWFKLKNLKNISQNSLISPMMYFFHTSAVDILISSLDVHKRNRV